MIRFTGGEGLICRPYGAERLWDLADVFFY